MVKKAVLCTTIRHFLVFLERFSISSVGYSPVRRDLALWDGILDIENRLLCWILDILPLCGIPQGGTGYWILSLVAAMPLCVLSVLSGENRFSSTAL